MASLNFNQCKKITCKYKPKIPPRHHPAVSSFCPLHVVTTQTMVTQQISLAVQGRIEPKQTCELYFF